MAKKIFGPNVGIFGPNLVPKFFFRTFYLYWKLNIVASYRSMQFQGKLMNQTWENGKNPNFGPNFGTFVPNLGFNFFLWILPLLDVTTCCKLLLYAISRETNEPNLKKWQKKLVLGPILAPLAQIWFQKFFS